MIKEKNVYPSGDFAIWIIIYIEFITFGFFFIGFAVSRRYELELFNDSQELLNKNLGLLNTIILITSSFFLVKAIEYVKDNKDNKKASFFILASLFLALCFLLIKTIEFYHYNSLGLNISTNTFFMFYFLLTMFHFMHVVLGALILFILFKNTSKGIYNVSSYQGLQTGAMYWHLIDFLWIIIFPLLYILR